MKHVEKTLLDFRDLAVVVVYSMIPDMCLIDKAIHYIFILTIHNLAQQTKRWNVFGDLFEVNRSLKIV
jgi:hypothetical protein